MHEWETNNVRSRATYAEPAQAPQCEHLTSWFAHAMRCSYGTSNSFAFLDSTAFWRGDLMHVMCVCVYGTTGVLHLWT